MVGEIKEILADELKLDSIAKEAFNSVDADESGSINKSQLKQLMASISNDLGFEEDAQDDFEEVINTLDTNKSGLFTLEEFKNLLRTILNFFVANVD